MALSISGDAKCLCRSRIIPTDCRHGDVTDLFLQKLSDWNVWNGRPGWPRAVTTSSLVTCVKRQNGPKKRWIRSKLKGDFPFYFKHGINAVISDLSNINVPSVHRSKRCFLSVSAVSVQMCSLSVWTRVQNAEPDSDSHWTCFMVLCSAF